MLIAAGSNESGMNFNARGAIDSDRFRELDRRQQYFDCTQHDWKKVDWSGRLIRPNQYQQNYFVVEQMPFYVPLKARRPSNPYRLAKLVVKSFTALLLGEHRFPNIRVIGDDDTQDFAEALIEAADIPSKFIRGRDLGGATGSVGFSWCFLNGNPTVNVHNGKNVHIQSWEDRDQLIPKWVTEVYRYPNDEYDGATRKWKREWYWHRRDWNQSMDIVFTDVKFKPGEDPTWIVDEEKSVQHDDGLTHFVWVQNEPTDDIDGLPDAEGLWENFDTLDIIASAIAQGTICNVDPTLILMMDQDFVNRMGIKKGSDNALTVGKDGDAKYLELAGSSIDIAMKLLEVCRKYILEVAQCVITDPNEVAAAGVSAVALRTIYAPMIAKTEIYRQQYGKALKRLLEQMLTVAQKRYSEIVILPGGGDDGEDVEATYVVNLPPRVETEPVLDPVSGEQTGEETVLVERNPGEGSNLGLDWGPYFNPTPTDQTQVVTALSLAVGGKAIMSTETAIELVAAAYNRKPKEEIDRVNAQTAKATAANAAMFGDDAAGGMVETEDGLPPGAPQTGLPPTQPKENPFDSVTLTSTDMAGLFTVNQLLTMKFGLPAKTLANGRPDPDGELTLAAFKAKNAATLAASANVDKGTVGTTKAPTGEEKKPPAFGGAEEE